MVRKIALLTALATVAAAIASVAAVANTGDKAVGGGQTMVGERGAGDTIAFSALENGKGIVGQVQYVDREGGTGKGQTVLHGTVDCLEVAENVAVFAGTWNSGGDFEVYVEDNGEPNQGNDMIFVNQEAAEPDCQEDDNYEDDATSLSRGNAQVFDR